ncbi:MAG: anti-sigma factor antagonist [Oscillospiraceae bacterium]|nr:anti-sigma factor antagonist [Oscillospiraceae bacterium]
MELKTECSSGYLFIRMKGELDHHAAKMTLQGIESAIDRFLPRHCALEMSGLSFMDSSGIAVILRAKRRVGTGGGDLILLDPSPQVWRVLTASGVDRLVPVKIREGRIAK